MMEKIHELLTLFHVDYYDSGEMLIAACPAHGGDNVSAFNININKGSKFYGIWFCNTHQCHNRHGKDILALTRILLSNSLGRAVAFPEVISFAKKFTDDIDDMRISIKNKQKKETEQYKTCPKSNFKRDDVRARLIIPAEYYIRRGFCPETLNDHDIGLCKNVGSEMYNRIVFPVYDENDEFLIGCVGRSIHADSNLRWKNKKGFNKARFLYNYGKALPHIKKHGAIILVEGQGDVLKLYQCGIKNAVGLFGSKLSSTQEFLLQCSGANTVIIATDNDEVGKQSSIDIHNKLNHSFNTLTININKKDIGDMTDKEIESDIKPQIRGLF